MQVAEADSVIQCKSRSVRNTKWQHGWCIWCCSRADPHNTKQSISITQVRVCTHGRSWRRQILYCMAVFILSLVFTLNVHQWLAEGSCGRSKTKS
jgi:hypothetical protein